MPGVLPEGFVTKSLAEIRADIVARLVESPDVGPSQDYSDTDPLGQIIGALASEIAELWELGYAVHTSGDPEGALDVALDQLLALAGSERIGARASTATCTMNLDAGALVPAGSLISVDGRPDIQFSLDEDVENTGGVAADFDGEFTCTVDGPVGANADTLTVIDSAVSGWNSVTNPEDAVRGRNAANNVEFRQRWADERARAGSTTVAAIRAALLDTETTPEFETIEKVLVLQNKTSAYDANGLPPHSVEAIIDDGNVPSVDNDLIAQVLWDRGTAGGIDTHGDESGTATDSEENPQTMYFSRVTRREIYIEIEVDTGSAFPTDGVAKLKTKLAEVGNLYDVEEDVIAQFIKLQAFSIAGVLDVPAFAIGFSASPVTETNLPIGYRERAVFDTTRIEVTT